MIKYSVNEKKKSVAAYFEDDDMRGLDILAVDLMCYARAKLNRGESDNGFSLDVSDGILFKMVHKFVSRYTERSVRGVARCHEGDKWNETVGKSVARRKLIEKERRIFEKFRKYFNKEVEKAAKKTSF